MAKKKTDSASRNSERGETVAGYFRAVFKENPKLLGERSNEKLLRRWLADHPEHKEVPRSVKNNLANLKSVLRSQRRARVARRAGEMESVAQHQVVEVARVPSGGSELEALEHQIDECLIRANIIDKHGLEDVIHHLRRARNAVVWKIGQ